jgi:hypothetical protein
LGTVVGIIKALSMAVAGTGGFAVVAGISEALVPPLWGWRWPSSRLSSTIIFKPDLDLNGLLHSSCKDSQNMSA